MAIFEPWLSFLPSEALVVVRLPVVCVFAVPAPILPHMLVFNLGLIMVMLYAVRGTSELEVLVCVNIPSDAFS